jgi:mono/diheme cytochrome c family protein
MRPTRAGARLRSPPARCASAFGLLAARHAAVGAALAIAAAANAAPGPREDYLLHCSGCHQQSGAGIPGLVPSLSDLAPFLATAEGRAYLVRVPGVAQAALDDDRLATLLNWVLREMSGKAPDPGYDASEVQALRRAPLRDAAAQRRAVLERRAR